MMQFLDRYRLRRLCYGDGKVSKDGEEEIV